MDPRFVRHALAGLGLNRRRFIDPNGETNRQVQTITAKHPGHMVHLDVKKVGRIPNGGGWRAHGKGSPEARAAARARARGARTGYAYLHSAIDGHTRLAYTESLENEQATTAVAFLNRAREWFATHGITRIERIITDNGACYRSAAFAHDPTPLPDRGPFTLAFWMLSPPHHRHRHRPRGGEHRHRPRAGVVARVAGADDVTAHDVLLRWVFLSG